jgi:tRNA A-37 threonylcarbamoyl transferase component Bud32
MEGNDILSVISHCNKKTVEQCIINDVKKIKKEKCRWDKRNEIGSGKHGTAYSVCCNEDCNYIVKVINFEKKNKDKKIKSFIDEANIQTKFHSHGMAPRVIVACYCDHEGVILMDKVQLLQDYLVEHPNANRSYIKNKYLAAYKNLLEKGLIHGDTNPGNIALSLDGSKPMFIDFGLSKEKKLDEDDIKQELHEFDMSLELVFTGKKTDEKAKLDEKPKKQTKSRIANISRVPKRGKNMFDTSDDEEDEIPRRGKNMFQSSDDEEDEIPRRGKNMFQSSDDEEESDSLSVPRRGKNMFESSDDEEEDTPKRRLF